MVVADGGLGMAGQPPLEIDLSTLPENAVVYDIVYTPLETRLLAQAREQMRALDEDYNQWRQDRFKKFSDEFSTWRSSRQQAAGTGKSEGGSPSSGKQNKDNS